LFTKEKKYILPSLFGLIGATIGLIIVLSHNFYYSGEWLQNSSVVKAYWSSIFGYSPIRIIFQSVRAFLYIPTMSIEFNAYVNAVNYLTYVFFVIIALSLAVIMKKINLLKLAFSNLKDKIKNKLNDFFLFLASLFIIIAYIVVYSFSFSAYIWYTSLLTVPFFIVIFYIYNNINVQILRSFYILASVFVVFINIFFFKNFLPFEGFVEARNKTLGVLLKQNIANHKVGISDSGKISFYQGGKVINLDGLVNNEIKGYLYSNQIECYLLDKKIKYANEDGMTKFLVDDSQWSKFSTPYVLSKEYDYILHEIDFEKLAKLPKCANRTAAEIFVK